MDSKKDPKKVEKRPASPKREYVRPQVRSEPVIERLALASQCGVPTPAGDCPEL